MTKIILAVFAPFLMIIFFTRVTFNHYIATVLTLGIILAIFKGYGEPTLVLITWIFSVLAGFVVSARMMKKLKDKNKQKYS
ncbi:DUF2198 family protein [Calidifontibacillus oryziterrae]|uniref:DUF2198 family protein n=1 Tax=Calidifontibacillus oryziterrae TaxID=1191699 RepID=UPI0002FC724C|nr:DUF2198 family protein [Calidifontibacillus oryziterrae]